MEKKDRLRSIAFLIVFTLALCSAVLPAAAQVVRDGPVGAQLASEGLSVQAGRPFSVALVLSMDPEWHVYWKNPGDSGLPTTIDWILPPGFAAGPLQWPVPQRFVTDGLVTYGYSGQVVLITEITPPKQFPPDAVLKLAARAGWLACRVECVPGKAALSVSLRALPGRPAADPRWAPAFSTTRSQLPAPRVAVDYSAAADLRAVTITGTSSPAAKGGQVLFYPDAPGEVRVSSPQQSTGDGTSLRLRMERDAGSGALLRLTGLLVAASAAGTRAIELDLPVSVLRSQGLGLVAALLLAFIGGLILNLMPCVLPVISLKVLSFVKHGGEQRKAVARQGLLFALGVLVSFWLVAGVLVALRSGGRLLGWGFQFQDPAVVLITAVLFFLVGLNLFGVFEVGAFLTRLGGAGRGRAGSFFSGIFAAAVATPCTAPFMGVAVGYALTHSLGASFGVFSALALGMAAPYVLLSVVPGLVSRLPKPGPWMDTFRQVMAFPMMAAVIWLVSIFAALAGSAAVILLLGALLASGLGAWAWGRWGSLSRAAAVRLAAGLAAILLAVGGTSLAVALVRPSSQAPAAEAAAETRWEPWSQARLDALRQAGTPVFLDFTAKWCLSCQVNEKVALDNPAVLKGFDAAGIVTLRADWTDSSDAIARALAAFGRASVPLYVFYPRGGKEPVILPEILTPGIVLQAIAR